MINTAIIIGTAIMTASNAAIMAVTIICLLDNAGLFNFEQMARTCKRRSICRSNRKPTNNCHSKRECQEREQCYFFPLAVRLLDRNNTTRPKRIER